MRRKQYCCSQPVIVAKAMVVQSSYQRTVPERSYHSKSQILRTQKILRSQNRILGVPESDFGYELIYAYTNKKYTQNRKITNT
jgi:hypothetical protein